MSKINLIGISGRAGSGKSTVAAMIQDIATENWEVKSYAHKLKQCVSIITGIPIEKFEDQEFKKQLMPKSWEIKIIAGELNKKVIKSANLVDGFDLVDAPDRFIIEKKIRHTYREFLQLFGTEAGRAINPNIWINALFSGHNENKYWIISDMRFPNEANTIKERGGVIIRLNRNQGEPATHKSETELDNYKFDFTINNEFISIPETKEKVKQMLKHFKIKYKVIEKI